MCWPSGAQPPNPTTFGITIGTPGDAVSVPAGLSERVADGNGRADGVEVAGREGVGDGGEEAAIGVGELAVLVADGVGEPLHETVDAIASRARAVRRITPIWTSGRIISFLLCARVVVSDSDGAS